MKLEKVGLMVENSNTAFEGLKASAAAKVETKRIELVGPWAKM